MFRRIVNLSGLISDYTVGTVIVMVHMARAERMSRPRLSA